MGEYVNLVEKIWQTITEQDTEKLIKLLNQSKINRKFDRYGNGVIHLLRLLDSNNPIHLKYFNLITQQPFINLNLQNRNGETLLHIASYDIIKLLNFNKILIDEKNIKGKTPLMVHLEKGNIEICFLLIKNGANCNLIDNEGNSILHKIYWFNLNNSQLKLLFEIIIKQIRDVNVQNKNGDTILHIIECPLMFQYLLLNYYNLNINIKNFNKNTPLMKQIRKNLKISELLVKNGADINMGSDIEAPIHKLYDFNLNNSLNYNFFNLLLNHPKIILNNKNKYGQTLLHLAKECKIVEELLKYNVDINVRDDDGNTPLMLHLTKNKDICLLLLKHRANLNLANNNKNNLIHKIEVMDSSIYNFIINHPNLNIDTINNRGENALHLIKTYKKAKDLIDKNININLQDNDGNSPLMRQLLEGNLDICKLLVTRGCDINLINNEGNTVLHLLGILKIKDSFCYTIIKHTEININIKNKKGQIILDFTDAELTRQLLELPFDPPLLVKGLWHREHLITKKIYQIWDKYFEESFLIRLIDYIGEIRVNQTIATEIYLYLLKNIANYLINDEIFKGFFKNIKQPFMQYYSMYYNPNRNDFKLFLEPYAKFSNNLQFNDVILVFYTLNDCDLLRYIIKRINPIEISKLGLNDSPFLYLITHPFNLNNLNLLASKILMESNYHVIFEIQNIARFCTLTPDLLLVYKNALKALKVLNNFDLVLKQMNINRPRTLLELSRNQFRSFLIKKYKIHYFYDLYWILNEIGLPELIKEIILLEMPLYQIEKPFVPDQMAEIFGEF